MIMRDQIMITSDPIVNATHEIMIMRDQIMITSDSIVNATHEIMIMRDQIMITSDSIRNGPTPVSAPLNLTAAKEPLHKSPHLAFCPPSPRLRGEGARRADVGLCRGSLGLRRPHPGHGPLPDPV